MARSGAIKERSDGGSKELNGMVACMHAINQSINQSLMKTMNMNEYSTRMCRNETTGRRYGIRPCALA